MGRLNEIIKKALAYISILTLMTIVSIMPASADWRDDVINTKRKIDALWMVFRAALAEQFSRSMDEFYNYLSLEVCKT